MKIKNGFVRREVAGTYVVVSVGMQDNNFNGMIKLNETSNFLWEKLENGAERDELVYLMTEEYDVDTAIASKDVDNFITELKKVGCVE